MAHVAREGHLMSAQICVEACEQPLWLRSKLDPKRPVKMNLLAVCELRGVQLRMWCLATPEQIKLEFTALSVLTQYRASWETARMALQHWHGFGGQKKEDARVVVSSGGI